MTKEPAEHAYSVEAEYTEPANSDPRKAQTLDEAAQNPNGTWDVAKALSWLTEVLSPGNGIPVEEVRQQFAAAIEKKRQQTTPGDGNDPAT